MARRNHLDVFTRGRMIGKLEEGRTVTSVAAEFGINKKCRFSRLESIPNDRYSCKERLVVAARGRQQASLLSNSTATGRQVSRMTDMNHPAGEHKNWTRAVMASVICSGHGFIPVTSRKDTITLGEALCNGRATSVAVLFPMCVCQVTTSFSWMTMHGHIGPCFRYRRYHSNGLASVLPRFKSHRTCVECFDRIAARLHYSENIQQLKQMLIEEWALLPQEMLCQLVLSMRRRCEVTIAVRGGHIPY
ncbi:transposable element Tcb2 transposase [Trichonephila clavipes]|uniref:Transposable element Tcb2 transposase n=1 Tax=Trichonephila clavipes TaxID=2585209 RepID=A0A8X7BL14_TRICX|nr:transposable element Tcb2 transposase [Trichonephila clavipes]